jgi:hypothetical protein
LVPLLSARFTDAPAVWPDCASNAFVCTLNSAIRVGGRREADDAVVVAGVVGSATRGSARRRA